jgi:hypothetical protein
MHSCLFLNYKWYNTKKATQFVFIKSFSKFILSNIILCAYQHSFLNAIADEVAF